MNEELLGGYDPHAGRIAILRGQKAFDTLFTIMHETGHAFSWHFPGQILAEPDTIRAAKLPPEFVIELLRVISERRGDEALRPFVTPLLQIITADQLSLVNLANRLSFVKHDGLERFFARAARLLKPQTVEEEEADEVAAYWFEIAAYLAIRSIPGLVLDHDHFWCPNHHHFASALRLFRTNQRPETLFDLKQDSDCTLVFLDNSGGTLP